MTTNIVIDEERLKYARIFFMREFIVLREHSFDDSHHKHAVSAIREAGRIPNAVVYDMKKNKVIFVSKAVT